MFADDDAGDDDAVGDDDSEGIDADGDGCEAPFDCDDTDPTLNWDDLDADGWATCDGDCDDFDAALNLADKDGDGFSTCTDDCNDLDNSLDPGDADGDGYSTCDGDCDDGVALTWPDAPEQCDGLDNDGDGTVDEDTGADGDGDGYTSCDGDCDDGNAGVHPGGTPICDGHTDNDCDGVPDANETDGDGDGYIECSGDCDEGNAAVHPGAADVCDGVADNDCDGVTDPLESDDDGDGQAECSNDCDDGNAAVFLGGSEICDGLDNDCDGQAEQAGDGVCGLWTLQLSATNWDAQALNPTGSPAGPSLPIQAAFGMGDLGQVWVLTGSTWHALNDSTLAWIGSGSRDDYFPELSGQTVLAGSAAPAYFIGDDWARIFLYTSSTIYYYDYDLPSGLVSLNSTEAISNMCCAPSQPVFSQIDAAWMDLYNAQGWVTEGSPQDICGECNSYMERYLAMIAAGSIHLFDTCCDEFFFSDTAASWNIFNYSGAPDPGIAPAAAWTLGALFVFGP